MRKVKLNLGCGTDIMEGFVNVDLSDSKGVDIIHDLNKFPYPFKDNSVDYILMCHVIEHLDNPLKVMKELNRILKKGGELYIRTPHFSTPYFYLDLTHKRPFHSQSFNTFKNENYLNRDKGCRFKVKSKLVFPRLYWLLLVPLWGNIFKNIYETFFPYIFPVREIKFNMIKIGKEEQ